MATTDGSSRKRVRMGYNERRRSIIRAAGVQFLDRAYSQLSISDSQRRRVWPAAHATERETKRTLDVLIELMGLGAFRGKLTGEALHTRTRRIVELVCLLASDARVIVFDELSGGVAQKETEALGPLLQRLQAATGTAILVIEHDLPLLSSRCDEMSPWSWVA